MRLFIFLFYFFCIGTVHAIEVTDDIGHKIQLAHPATRIISLAPDLTELLFTVGAGNSIIGVIQGSDYPAAAKKIPLVGNYNSVNLEKILALQPDLIVAWQDESFLPSLQKLGIPIYVSHQHQLTDIPQTLKRLGSLTGKASLAEPIRLQFLERYNALQKKYASQKPLNVFYQLSSQPLLTVTRQSWINEVITLCGGKNIFANLPGMAPEINPEAVLKANPDVIIASEKTQRWETFTRLTAVQKKHLFMINPDLIERASTRLLDGADCICRDLALARG